MTRRSRNNENIMTTYKDGDSTPTDILKHRLSQRGIRQVTGTNKVKIKMCLKQRVEIAIVV